MALLLASGCEGERTPAEIVRERIQNCLLDGDGCGAPPGTPLRDWIAPDLWIGVFHPGAERSTLSGGGGVAISLGSSHSLICPDVPPLTVDLNGVELLQTYVETTPGYMHCGLMAEWQLGAVDLPAPGDGEAEITVTDNDTSLTAIVPRLLAPLGYDLPDGEVEAGAVLVFRPLADAAEYAGSVVLACEGEGCPYEDLEAVTDPEGLVTILTPAQCPEGVWQISFMVGRRMSDSAECTVPCDVVQETRVAFDVAVTAQAD